MLKRFFCLVSVLLFSVLPSAAEMYRYTDPAGNVALTDDYRSIPEALRQGASEVTGEHIDDLESGSIIAAQGLRCYRYTDKDGNIVITNDRASISKEYLSNIIIITPGATDVTKQPWYAEMKQAGASDGELSTFAMAGGPDEEAISQAGVAEKLKEAVGADMKNALKMPKTKEDILDNPLFWLSVSAVSSIIAVIVLFAYIEKPGMRCMLAVMLLSAINIGTGAVYAQRLMGKYDILAKIKQMQTVTRQIRSLAGE